MLKLINNIMDIIPQFIKTLCKIVLTYICIIFCIKCRDKCIDDNNDNNITPINSNENINYNSTNNENDNNKNKKHHPILETYENKIKEKLENSNI